jgi:PAS domain S-box-containing protein/putative nucleotidyltransferase with HDIG domain
MPPTHCSYLSCKHISHEPLEKGKKVEDKLIKVLLIEDNPQDVRLIWEMLSKAQDRRFELECVDQLSSGLVRLAANDIGVVLLDLDLPDSQGLDAFSKAYAQAPCVPIVVMSNRTDEEMAIKTVQEGAQDYLVKDKITSDLLVRAIRYAIERKRAEEALRGQALIFDNIHDSIIMTDLMGNIMRWNPAAERMFGYYRDEVFCKTLDVLATRIVDGQLRAGRWAGEMNFTRKDGTEVICETSVIPLCDERGTITAVCGVSHDITKHKEAEEALRKSEQQLRLITDRVTDVIWSMDLVGNFTFITPSAERVVGYSVEEMLSLNLKQIITPESYKMTIDSLRELLKVGKREPVTMELEQVCKDGAKKWCEVTASLSLDQNNHPTGIIGVTRDITERKRAEEALQKTYHQLRESLITTVNTLASTVEMRDPYTAGHQRRVTLLACAIAEEMGLPEEQFDGLRLAGLVHDIGKITVPAEILNKPGRISEIEFNIIKTHPQAGYNLLKEIAFPWPVARIVLQHHERLDGSGYPQGLKDGGITMEAKILAVADVVEAMASHRPYRSALGIEAALHEITMNKGILYDSNVSDLCVRLFTEEGFVLGQEM